MNTSAGEAERQAKTWGADRDMKDLIDVTIVQREEQAGGIISLDLAADGGQLPSFRAGAHVDVHIGTSLIRQYSLCNDPIERHRYRLGILLAPNSRGGSLEIHRSFAVGTAIRIGQPRNNFALVEAAQRSILVAGGIGITPLLSMAYRLQNLGTDFELHYCTRSSSRTAFSDEISKTRFTSRVIMHYDDAPGSQRFTVGTSLPAPSHDTHLYTCGPTGFMDYVTDGALRQGWPADHIHIEHFTRSAAAGGEAFVVNAVRSGVTCEVPPGKSIAAALLDHGVDVLLSCEQGLCGICLTTVLEGIPDHRDTFQTEEEKAANTQLAICCSRAKSSVLVLDI